MSEPTNNTSMQNAVITYDDIVKVIDKRIIERFYMMYKGLMQGYTYDETNNKLYELKNDYMLVLKAFFIPPTVLSDIPSDNQAFASVYQKNNHDSAWWKKTDYNGAYNKTLQSVLKFRGVEKDKFLNQIYGLGHFRRLEILTEHFKLDSELILSGLFYIQQYTNEFIINARKQQQYEQQRAEEQAKKVEEEKEISDDSKSKSFKALFNYV